MKLVCRPVLCVTSIDESNSEYWVFEVPALIPKQIFACVLKLATASWCGKTEGQMTFVSFLTFLCLL